MGEIPIGTISVQNTNTKALQHRWEDHEITAENIAVGHLIHLVLNKNEENVLTNRRRRTKRQETTNSVDNRMSSSGKQKLSKTEDG